jgi:putative hydrolase of the HAD superfamily
MHILPRRPKYLLFDAGGTLLGTNTSCEHWYEQFFVDACAEQGCEVSLESVREALHAAVSCYNGESRCSTPEQVRTFWEHVYAHTFRKVMGHGSGAEEIAMQYIDRYERGEFVELFADTLPALNALRKQHLPMAVVSNFGEYLEDFLRLTRIDSFFEFVVISARVKCEKPQEAIFDLAISRTGVAPGEILFIGDNVREDYEASERHGMMPLLIDRHDKLSSRKDIVRVNSLLEIARLIEPEACSTRRTDRPLA